jgi:hypothetical protein
MRSSPTFFKAKGHYSTCTERVSTDMGDTVARIEEARKDDAFADGQGDLCGQDVGAGGNKADWKGVIVGCGAVEVISASGQRFDGTEGAWARRMIHGAATLAIFLVIDIEADAVGFL